MPRIVLILMVKNESKIIRRCLESVEKIVDAFCVCDTGSTDNTCEIVREFLETHHGCLTECPWQNFGFNRTQSFVDAQKFVATMGWPLDKTYGLLLDADMCFVPGTLLSQPLTEKGYTIIQCAGGLEYPNCRLVRMDYEWRCRGVTHEYWDGPTTPLPKTICHIDDRNDGGCKSDKFERDARLLEQGLQDEPENVRYMFYLAQTYHSLGRWKDCIAMYKRRIVAGGWEEEVWYSHYMIAQAHKTLGNLDKFEAWMLKAFKRRPSRAEPLYKLAKHFREVSQHYKAYQYVLMGRAIPFPPDSLFIEKDVYNGLFDYEATILLFYLQNTLQDGLRMSMKHMLGNKPMTHNVYENVGFYISPIAKQIRPHPVLRDECGLDYHPTSVSCITLRGMMYHNVRFVNYHINQQTGSYTMRENGKLSESNKVRTQNLLWTNDSSKMMKDESVTLPRKDSHIRGLEDVRLYVNDKDQVCFTATTAEYADKIRVMHGEYDIDNGVYKNCVLLQSPTHAECEKNWIPISGTRDILYRWSPLEVGHIDGDQLRIDTRHTTPWFFQHLRGSAVPFRVDNELWCLVHFVEYSTPRKYYHCFVRLDGETYAPKAISMPFVFRARSIEYCIGCTRRSEKIEFIFSSMDDNPCITEISMRDLEWLQV